MRQRSRSWLPRARSGPSHPASREAVADVALGPRNMGASVPAHQPREGALDGSLSAYSCGGSCRLGALAPHGIPFSPPSRMDHRRRAKRRIAGCQIRSHRQLGSAGHCLTSPRAQGNPPARSEAPLDAGARQDWIDWVARLERLVAVGDSGARGLRQYGNIVGNVCIRKVEKTGVRLPNS